MLFRSDSCLLPARSMIHWFGRSFLHVFGWHVRLEDETLGASRGFTYKIGVRGKQGWYGWFAQAAYMIRVDFQPQGRAPQFEVTAARGILASLKCTKMGDTVSSQNP